MSFWDAYKPEPETAGSGSQDDTSGVCEFCGLAGDDVLVGVCGPCTPEECSCSGGCGPAYRG